MPPIAVSGGHEPDAAVPPTPSQLCSTDKGVSQIFAVALIINPQRAERIVSEGEADFVALARALLDEPHWGWRAARELGGEVAYPPQYARAAPEVWPGHKFQEESSVMD